MRTTSRTVRTFLQVGMVATLAAACTLSPDAEEQIPDDEFAEDVRDLEEVADDVGLTVDDLVVSEVVPDIEAGEDDPGKYQLELSQDPGVPVGSVLKIDPGGEQLPNGFAARVEAITPQRDGTILVETSKIELTDLFETLTIDVDVAYSGDGTAVVIDNLAPESDVQALYLPVPLASVQPFGVQQSDDDGVFEAGNQMSHNLEADTSYCDSWSNQWTRACRAGFDVSLKASGELTMAYDLRIVIRDGEMEEFRLVGTWQSEAEFTVKPTLGGDLSDVRLQPFQRSLPGVWAGPVYISPVLGVEAKLEVALPMSFGFTVGATAGLAFGEDGWEGTDEDVMSFVPFFTPDASTAITMKAAVVPYVMPRFFLLIDGPRLELELGTEAVAQTSCPELSGSFYAAVNGSYRAPGATLLEEAGVLAKFTTFRSELWRTNDDWGPHWQLPEDCPSDDLSNQASRADGTDESMAVMASSEQIGPVEFGMLIDEAVASLSSTLGVEPSSVEQQCAPDISQTIWPGEAVLYSESGQVVGYFANSSEVSTPFGIAIGDDRGSLSRSSAISEPVDGWGFTLPGSILGEIAPESPQTSEFDPTADLPDPTEGDRVSSLRAGTTCPIL